MDFGNNINVGGVKMKIGGIIGIIILITGIFLVGGLLIDDFEKNYVETNISSVDSINQSLREELVGIEEINDTFKPLMKNFDDLKEATGWFDALLTGAVVLPKAFVNFIVAVAIMIGLTLKQTTVILKFMQIALPIVSVIFVALIVWFFFKMMEQLRRYPT